MKLNCGKRRSTKVKEKYDNDLKKAKEKAELLKKHGGLYHYAFPYPIKVGDNDCRWFEFVKTPVYDIEVHGDNIFREGPAASYRRKETIALEADEKPIKRLFELTSGQEVLIMVLICAAFLFFVITNVRVA
jgi:hypothetical protein